MVIQWGREVLARVTTAHQKSDRILCRNLVLTQKRALIITMAIAASIQVTMRISGPLPPNGWSPNCVDDESDMLYSGSHHLYSPKYLEQYE